MKDKPKTKRERIEKKLEDIRRGKWKATAGDIVKLQDELSKCKRG